MDSKHGLNMDWDRMNRLKDRKRTQENDFSPETRIQRALHREAGGAMEVVMARLRVAACVLAAVAGMSLAAHALECEGGMAPVRDAFCMDVYEYPNMAGALPLNSITHADAAKQCRAQGKRLCTVAELHAACAGPAGLAYPYGGEQRADACAAGERKRSGAAAGCKSGYGIFDLCGNLAEWAADGGVHGGSYESAAGQSCGAVSQMDAAGEYAGVGFRCCSGPVMAYAPIPAPAASEPTGAQQAAVASAVEPPPGPAPAVAPKLPAEQETKPLPALEAKPHKGIPADNEKEVRRHTTRKRRHWEDKDLPARAVVSSLTRMHPGHLREGAYTSFQYQDLGNVYSPQTMNAQVSAWAWAYTMGYKFDDALTLETTVVDHRVEERRNNAWSDLRDTDFVWHASYAVADLFDGELWPGDLVAGVRRFDNPAGQVTEFYAAKEFVHGPWVVTPAVNYLSRTTRENAPGLSLDVRYYISPYFNFFGYYNSQDFYKSVVNDYLAPMTSLGPLANCADCDESSASLGMDYGVFKHQGGLFFQVFDIGDLNAPMGGLYLNF